MRSSGVCIANGLISEVKAEASMGSDSVRTRVAMATPFLTNGNGRVSEERTLRIQLCPLEARSIRSTEGQSHRFRRTDNG